MTEDEAHLVVIAEVVRQLLGRVEDVQATLDTIDLRTERTLEMVERLAGETERR